MRTMSMTCILVAGALGLGLAANASAHADRQRSERESQFSREEIDDAISDAEKSAEEYQEAMEDVVEDGPQDARKREESLREEVGKLVDAVKRLRDDFDEDKGWADQRAEVRTAYGQWKKLDPKMRHHWASEAHDEFRDLHEDLRRLARIYEVDSPPRR